MLLYSSELTEFGSGAIETIAGDSGSYMIVLFARESHAALPDLYGIISIEFWPSEIIVLKPNHPVGAFSSYRNTSSLSATSNSRPGLTVNFVYWSYEYVSIL